jgi:hypothetical protein
MVQVVQLLHQGKVTLVVQQIIHKPLLVAVGLVL